jgi:ABC-type multidrug transport system fused ATPase/permease subunit
VAGKVPDDNKGGSTPAPSEGLLGRLSELAWKALPAIGSAIGFVGFVAIVGGAVEWIRFDAANLPATQAVLAVPKQELVVIGALALGVFVLGAMLAVLVVYLIDSDGNATPRTARGLIAVGVAEMAVTLFFIGHHDALKYVWLGLWLLLILFVAGYLVGLVMRDFRRRTKVRHARARVIEAQRALTAAVTAQAAAELNDDASVAKARAQARVASQKAREEFRRAIGEWMFAAKRVIDIQRRSTRQSTAEKIDRRLERVEALGTLTPGVVEVEAALDEAERGLGHAYLAAASQATDDMVGPPKVDDDAGLASVWVTLLVLGLAAAVIGFGFYLFADEVTWAAILFIVIALLTTMNVFVARATDKFALYGIAVFFSVLLFGAALTIARTLHEPKVQPVALLRKGNELGLCGVYITQTKDRVYVGRLNLPDHYRPGLIFWVPTSEVELVSVGQPESIRKSSGPKPLGLSTFQVDAERMLDRLYEERAEEAAPVLKNETISEEQSSPGDPAKPGSQTGKTTKTREAPSEQWRSKRHPNVKIYGNSCTATQHVDP